MSELSKDIARQYTHTLEELTQLQMDLGLKNDPPTQAITIIPGTEGKGRPVGGQLPVYPVETCGTDDKNGEKARKILFNLKSLIPGFEIPKKYAPQSKALQTGKSK